MVIDSVGILIAMILVCIGLILIMILARPIKILFKFLLNAVIGAGVLSVLHYMGLSVGANFVTAGIIGLLGIPGFIGLMVAQVIL